MITETDKQECESILDQQRVWRDGDIVFWSYILPDVGVVDRYWCKAQKAVYFEDCQQFHDLYWIHRHGEKYGRINSSGFIFLPVQIGQIIQAKYKGNLDEFDRQNVDYDYLSKRYEESDILYLNHPNDSRGNMYLRKGAKKSLARIKKALEMKIFDLEGQVKYSAGELVRAKNEMKNLTEETIDGIYV